MKRTKKNTKTKRKPIKLPSYSQIIAFLQELNSQTILLQFYWEGSSSGTLRFQARLIENVDPFVSTGLVNFATRYEEAIKRAGLKHLNTDDVKFNNTHNWFYFVFGA